jgi:hypothetical protein
LRVGAAAKGENSALFQFGSAAKSGAQLICLDLAKSRFTETLENLRNRKTGGVFNAVIEIDKAPGESVARAKEVWWSRDRGAKS